MMPKYHKKLNKKKYKRIEANVMPNLLKRDFNASKINQKWTTDITYLIYKDKRLYLSTILDLYDRKVVAYQISKFNDNVLLLNFIDFIICYNTMATAFTFFNKTGNYHEKTRFSHCIIISNDRRSSVPI